MSDYISRDEIFSVWRSMPKPASIASLTDAINRTPAADVEPVRCGRWELHGNDDDISASYFCSLCGYNFDEDEFLDRWSHIRYCPNCGAKMDLEDENDDN